MSEEAIFVAIGIACVVAVLLFIVFIIYCVKKQQEKEQERQLRQRRAREERHRRHLMRANIVRPPPYDPNRQNVIPVSQTVIPVSPPPEYKEVATPLPTHRNSPGYGVTGHTSYNGYTDQRDSTPTIAGNVAPVTTVFVGNNHFNNNSYVADNSSNNSDSYINRTTITTTRSGHVSTNTFQIQPQSIAAGNSEPVSRSSSSYSGSADYSYERNGHTNSVSELQRHPHAGTTQELSASALLIRQQNLPVSTVSSTKPGESRFYNSFSRNDANLQNNSASYHNYNGLFAAGRIANQTEINNSSEVQTGRSNNSRYTISRSTPATQTPRNLYDVNIVAVTPVRISASGRQQTRERSTEQKANHANNRNTGLEELSLI